MRVYLGILFATLLATALPLSGRTWTDVDGRELEAVIQKATEHSVIVLRDSDQRRLTLPLDRLCEADRSYALAWGDLQRNLQQRWPSSVRAPSFEVVATTGSEEGGTLYSYATDHFRFRSDAELSTRLVRHFASIFEVVYAAGEKIPLGIQPLPAGQTYSVRIFKSDDDYKAAGGLPGSAGAYSFKRKEVIVPLSSLAVTDESGVYRPESNPDYPTLIHEITHCVTSDWRDYAPVWVFEGLARYMEVVPHTRENLNFDGLKPRIAVWRSGNGTYDDVPVIDFEFMLGCSYKQWNKTFYNNPDNLRAQYTSAMVLVQYFLDFDNSQGAKFKHYLFELSQGMAQEEALEILLDGRSYEDLVREITDAYKRERVTFSTIVVD
ncbi:MAG: hypothetical protein ACSHX8_14740 [Opitutaceae bacterium]